MQVPPAGIPGALNRTPGRPGPHSWCNSGIPLVLSGNKQVGGWLCPRWRYILSCELVGAHGDAVDELHGAPQPVELHTLIHVHDAVGGRRAPPDGVLQVAPNAGQDHLEHGQATAQPLLGQQVTFPSDGDLLGKEGYANL